MERFQVPCLACVTAPDAKTAQDEVFCQVPHGAGIDWTVGTARPTADVAAELNKARRDRIERANAAAALDTESPDDN